MVPCSVPTHCSSSPSKYKCFALGSGVLASQRAGRARRRERERERERESKEAETSTETKARTSGILVILGLARRCVQERGWMDGWMDRLSNFTCPLLSLSYTCKHKFSSSSIPLC